MGFFAKRPILANSFMAATPQPRGIPGTPCS